ncbi:MAG: septal ring lytic transglycosylase RlpA family protein [Bosea sp. (in: a-proteobacteria)]
MWFVAGLGFVLANCAQQQQQSRLSSQESREAGSFSHRKFGTASPRVLAEGEAVPKGGGRDHVGRSYTIAGKRYTPYVKPIGYTITGQASWYGPAFHGRKTANGEIYDRHGVSAAHPTMPLPSYARVTNLSNRRSIVVRVNDRGPYHGGRVIDLSQRTADLLEFRHLGTARVRVEYVGRASVRGSDDRMLTASLTSDGTPAAIPGMSQPATLVANAPPLTSPRVTPATVQTDIAEVPAAIAQRQPVSRLALAEATAASAAPLAVSDIVRPVSGAPRPPERPFDLATIPGAATPTAFAGPQPGAARIAAAPSRPVVASLYFAKPIGPAQTFDRGHPLVRDLKPQKFLALR